MQYQLVVADTPLLQYCAVWTLAGLVGYTVQGRQTRNTKILGVQPNLHTDRILSV